MMSMQLVQLHIHVQARKHWTHRSLAIASLVNPTGLSLEICRAHTHALQGQTRG